MAPTWSSSAATDAPGPWATLSLAARHPATLSEQEDLRTRVLNDPHPECLVTLATRHRIAPLLARNLGPARERLAPAVQAALRRPLRAGLKRQLLLDAELDLVRKTLVSERVPLAPLKGPTLARRLYGDAALRPSRDVDVLVRPSDVRGAHRALERAGYRVVPSSWAGPDWVGRTRNAHVLLSRGAGLPVVELHWALQPPHVLPRALGLHAERHWIAFPEVEPPLEDLFVYLAVHGAKHRWRALGWVADLGVMLRRHPDFDWGGTVALARSTGCARLALLAAELARATVGAPTPNDLADRLGVPHRTRRWAGRFSPEPSPAPDAPPTGLADLGFLWRTRDDTRERVRALHRFLTTPTVDDVLDFRLPWRLRSLYGVVRLLRASSRWTRRALRQIRSAPGSRTPDSERP